MLINGVHVSHSGFVPFDGELKRYVDFAKQKKPDIVKLHIYLDDNGDIALDFEARGAKFERIRRITG